MADSLSEVLACFGVRREDWMKEAACRGKDTSLFFPGPGESRAPALRICARCPVRPECREYVERTHTRHGIWAGDILRRNEPPEVLESHEEFSKPPRAWRPMASSSPEEPEGAVESNADPTPED